MAGKIIFVNGASSSGKSTLCAALQAVLPEPFWHFSIDHIRDAGILPMERIRHGDFNWQEMRPAFFDGFHRCLPALAGAGNNLVVEYVVETEAVFHDILHLLRPFDVFFVGVHCPLDELERREAARGDRRIGSARQDYETTHQFITYDVEVFSENALTGNVAALIAAWERRTKRGAQWRMISALEDK